jgi:hypothetical protein
MQAAKPAVHGSSSASAPVARAALDDRVLDAIHQANLSFLMLAGARAVVAGGKPVFGLAVPLAARIARLDAAGLAAAA